MWSFILVLLTLTSLPLVAIEQETALLDWQPLSIEDENRTVIAARLRALPVPVGGKKKSDIRNKGYDRPLSGREINGKLTVRGSPFQSFTLCARQIETDANLSELVAISEEIRTSTVILQDGVANFTITGGIPCSQEVSAGLGYHWRQIIYSDQPFMVTQRLNAPPAKPPPKKIISGAYPVTGMLFPDKTLNEPGVIYGSGGTDEDDPFQKRPPFLPMPDKSDFSLTLLPVLRLASDWRHSLPGTQWWHWLLGEPDQEAGITLQLRYRGQPPLILRVSQVEFKEFSKHLLNVRQLLQWLAPKLNGREAFICQLLEIADKAPYTSLPLDEETRYRFQQQLMAVLEQPDTEFSLEFETRLLADSLSDLSQGASLEAGIIQLPKGKTEGLPDRLPADQGEQQSSKEQASDRPPDRAFRREQENNDEDGKQPGQPTGVKLNEQGGDGYFAIVVNRVRFYINKEQLSSLQRGQEEVSSIKAYKPENPAEILSLDEIEAVVGVQEENRLSKYNSSPLDYLLKYGTWATRTALKHFYPINLLSEYEGHLKAEINYQGYPVDQRCEICYENLLSQQSLTPCNHPSQHAFHTSCLTQWLRRDQAEIWCPFCQEDLPEQLSMLLAKELESELHHAVESGNRAVVEALLKTKVDIDAENANGSTPLWLACSRHQHDMVQLLLENNADAHQIGFEGMSLLDIAVLASPRYGYPEDVINLLLEKNVRMTVQGGRGIHDILNTSLQRALMIRYRQSPTGTPGLNSDQHLSQQKKKMEALSCFMCSTAENVETVNSLPVCRDCLQRQAEQVGMYENLRQPEQKDPQISSITDSIYLGNYDFASDREKLQNSGITSILVCGSSLKPYFPNDFNYHQLPIEDKTEQDISKFFAEAWDFIETERSHNSDSKILVHCHAGVSRSSSVVISYLMKKLNMGYKQAFDFVKARRPSIYPNEAFVLQLKSYQRFLEEEGLYGKKSEVGLLTEGLSSGSPENKEQPSHFEQDQPLPFLPLLPDNVLHDIFKCLSVESQAALSATCKRFRDYSCNNAEDLVLKTLEYTYYYDWMPEPIQMAERWLQEQQETIYEKFRICEVPDYLIDVSKKRPLYPLALLRYLSSRGQLKLQRNIALPEEFTVIGNLAVLPDGRLVTASRRSTHIKVSNNPSTWGTPPGRAENPNVITVAPEDRLAIGSIGGLLEIRSTKNIEKFRGEDYLECLYTKLAMCSIALLPDKYLALGQVGCVRLWSVGKIGGNPEHFELYYLAGYRKTCDTVLRVRGIVTALVFLHDGRLVAGTSYHRTVTIFDISSGTRMGPVKCDVDVRSMEVLPNGLLVAGGKLWNVETLTSVATLDAYNALALLPDGRLALGTDGGIKIWNVEKGCCETVYKGPERLITSFVVLPDGNMALTKENGVHKEDAGGMFVSPLNSGLVEIWDVYHPVKDRARSESCMGCTESAPEKK